MLDSYLFFTVCKNKIPNCKRLLEARPFICKQLMFKNNLCCHTCKSTLEG